MVNFNQDTFACFFLDMLMDQLWENSDFLNFFCSGCPVWWGNDCPTGLDPWGLRCERQGMRKAVEGILRGAVRDIVTEMESWGCTEDWR